MRHRLQTESMQYSVCYKKMPIVALCILQSSFLCSQEGHIKGKISDGTESLPAASVTIGDKSILSNSEGEYFISVKAGSYSIIITHTGYKKLEQQIIVTANANHIYNFNLAPSGLLDEITILGTRTQIPRSSLHTAVPVDAFSSNFLQQTGQSSLMQMLNFSAPSINSSRELANETITLYGLDPQHVLFTLNGTRYHNQALVNLGAPKGILGRSSPNNDLSSIPSAAIETVEILRHGASAQYGSDAIAAVLNLRLKKTIGKTEIRLHNGQYYEGDGEKYSLDFYRGFSLRKKGFISIASSTIFRKPTYRGGIYDGLIYLNFPRNPTSAADSARIREEDNIIIKSRNFDRRKIISNVGNIQQLNVGILLNGSYKITSNAEIFATLAFNDKNTRRESEYRFPKDSNVVNHVLFPDGYGPVSTHQIRDVSTIVGIKGKIKNGWRWELISSQGKNKLISQISNTNNPSQNYMGKDAQTKFKVGQQIYSRLTNNFNLSKR